MFKSIIAPVIAIAVAGLVSVNAEDAVPNDAQIAHIVVTANTIDVDYAKIAVKKTSNPEVKAFAETMIRDHSAVNKQAGELAKKLELVPEDNESSKAYNKAAKDEMIRLKSMEGEEFDREYVTNEVNFHTAVIEALDTVLYPNVKNEELKALMKAGRPIFVMHLEHAKKLQAKLAK